MGYIDWRISGLSRDVDANFEQFGDEFLQITGSDTLSSSAIDIELKNMTYLTYLYQWRKNMKIVLCNWFQIWRWWLVPNTDDCHVLVNLSSITILVLDILISTLLNSYWLINIIHLSLAIEIDDFLLTFFCQITPHVFVID